MSAAQNRPAPSPDAPLITACHAFHHAEATVKARDTAAAVPDADWASLVDRPAKTWWAAVGIVSACWEPQTAQGVPAKAAAAPISWTRFAGAKERDRPEIVLALATLRDVAGRVLP